MTNPNQWHDTVRDRIAQEYFNLPPLRCRFCKLETPIATEKVAYVVTEHWHGQFRADVAALTQQREVVGVVEVINTNPPNEQTLTSQSELASVFYVTLDALDDGFAGYCSPFCWRNRNEESVSPWSVPACSDCERPYHTMEYQYRLVDWENPGEEVCIECAAKTSGGQWRSPANSSWVIRKTGFPARMRTCSICLFRSPTRNFGLWSGPIELRRQERRGRLRRRRRFAWTR